MLALILQKKSVADATKIPNVESLQDLFENYDIVYAYKCNDPEQAFRDGNTKLARYLKYPLSVGDIVLLRSKGHIRAFLCLPVGWKLVIPHTPHEN